jgi:signal transduction histidine kinase
VIVSSFVLIYSYQEGTPVGRLLLLIVIEAALRYGMVGAVAFAVLVTPVQAIFEWLVVRNVYDRPYDVSNVTFQLGVGVITGLIAGWLVERLGRQTELASERASEAERLRDELGRRVDLLEAANRCARALGSSLDLDDAFGAFIRELRGLVPFERMAIVLAGEGAGEVMAAAGAGADTTFPPGSARPVKGSVLERVLDGQLVYRKDLTERQYAEEEELLELGLRCRLAAPLLLGPRAIGMLSVVRVEPDSFSAEEIELVSLLGRLVATAVQNIRNYDAERRTVEELRRLSALRADFVSLVSHELRSPMAAVIGAARTLQQRWRELRPDQRDSFLDLIAGETNRLAQLVADVLDTSRIEAGTFSYAFADVEVGRLVLDTVAAAGVGQDEVKVVAAVNGPLPRIRGDAERLRQVVGNLVDNAVKYSPDGGRITVRIEDRGASVRFAVTDEGIGIPASEQARVFDKFYRLDPNLTRGVGGTGLGLYICRELVRRMDGRISVASTPGEGTTFVVDLPVAAVSDGAARPAEIRASAFPQAL